MGHPEDLDSLDVEGLFCPATDRDRQIAGRLTFDSQDGGRLRLIGSSFDILPVAVGIDSPIRLHGRTTTASYTLEGCFPIRNRYPFNRVPDVVFNVPLILSTLLFEQDEELEFSSVQVSLRHLEPWLNTRKLSNRSLSAVTRPDGTRLAGHSSIAVTHPEIEAGQLLGGELNVAFDYDIAGDDFNSMTLSQRATVKFIPAGALGLDELMEAMGPVQHLVSIAADRPSLYTDVRFEHPDLTEFLKEHPSHERHVELYTRLRGSGLMGEATSPEPKDMLFSYEDIGGVDGLVKWILLAQKYRVVLDPLLGHKYLATTFVGNRLADAAGAAEAFYLIRYGDDVGAQSTLRTRMSALALHAGDSFCELIGDPDEWAEHVKSARTDIMHAGERITPRYNDAAYSALARSLYLLIVICLLRELDVGDDVINRAIWTRFQTVGLRQWEAADDVRPQDQQAEDPTS